VAVQWPYLVVMYSFSGTDMSLFAEMIGFTGVLMSPFWCRDGVEDKEPYGYRGVMSIMPRMRC
jgi:hypothetical protein